MSEEPADPIRRIPDRQTLPPHRTPVTGHPSGTGTDVAAPVVPPGSHPAGWQTSQPPMSPRTPHYRIRVRAVFCADDNGANAATVSAAQVEQMLTVASSIYAPAGLSLALASTETVPKTTLNQDVTIPPAADLTSTENPKDQYWWKPSFVQHNLDRDEYARKYRGQLVVFFRWGTGVKWDDTLKVWQVTGGGAFSGSNQEFVVMGAGDANARRFAHESGHYFHLNHTHSTRALLTDAEKAQYPDWASNQAHRDAGAAILRARLAEAIRAYVDDQGHPAEEGLQAFDGDEIPDTAPDVGPHLFRYVYGDQCAPDPVTVDVPLASGKRPYTVSAPLDLSMSYFYDCPGPKSFSPTQINIARAALETKVLTTTVLNEINQPVPVLSRHHLIEPPAGTVGDPSAGRPAKPPQTRPPKTRPSPDPATGWLARLRAVLTRR